jgi:hypothetical protein
VRLARHADDWSGLDPSIDTTIAGITTGSTCFELLTIDRAEATAFDLRKNKKISAPSAFRPNGV